MLGPALAGVATSGDRLAQAKQLEDHLNNPAPEQLPDLDPMAVAANPTLVLDSPQRLLQMITNQDIEIMNAIGGTKVALRVKHA